MPSKTICKADYKYGNLIYVVKIILENQAYDWENEKTVKGDYYFVDYTENTLPSKNRVGGFDSLADALNWVNSQFGQLEWEYAS